ncbi:MAG TPA: DUF881 domain-containing protein [Candidatus Dormibacteraeota bacterium]|nr:DUF881 domain-containing protein [Candidatus Dormibacteraeota bacterium]
MSTRPKTAHTTPSRTRAVGVWLIALLVALVATVQIRSEAEVARSLVGVDATSLAFLIDDLHRANDSLSLEKADLTQRRATLQSGGGGAADQVLTDEAVRLRALEGLVRVHGPGIVVVIDASGLTALDLQDTLNNLAAGGAEAIDVNDRRVVTGVPIAEMSDGVAVDGVIVVPPWKISVIGDAGRLSGVADLMSQQLRADRRVRSATYRVETDVVIRSVISEKPFVYAVASQNR